MRPALIAAALSLAVTALALPGTGQARTLGRLQATIDGHPVSYRVTDAPDAGSGWEIPASDASGTRRHLSILWKGRKPTDLMVMEMVIRDGKPVSARLLLPEAREGALEALMPKTLSVTLDQARTEGPWLKIAGHLSGLFHPLRSNGGLLPDDAVKVTARFDCWVPGIGGPQPAKPAKPAKPAPGLAPRTSPRPHLRGGKGQ